MAGPVALGSEVTGAANDAAAKVELPQSVGHDAGCHGIVRVGDPLGEIAAFPGRIVDGVFSGNFDFCLAEHRQESGWGHISL